MKTSAREAVFLAALSALAFAITLAILTFYAPRAYGLLQLASSLWLLGAVAAVFGPLLTLLSVLLRLSPSTASSAMRRRQHIILLHLAVGAMGIGSGIWILVESYAKIANLRFEMTAVHYAAISLVLSVSTISLAASLALLPRRSN